MGRRLTFFLAVATVVALGSVSCREKEDAAVTGIPEAFRGEPLAVGVCVGDPSSGPGLGVFQEKGLRAAHRAFQPSMGRGITLVFKKGIRNEADWDRAVGSLVREERVSGVISCDVPVPPGRMKEIVSGCEIPFVSICRRADGRAPDPAPNELRICTPPDVRARACACFISREVKAKRVALVVNGADGEAVRLASLFAEELSAMGAHLVDVVVKDGGSERTSGLERLSSLRVDAVFLPVDADAALGLVEEIRRRDASVPVLVAGPPAPGRLTARAAGILDGVYVQSDFAEDEVNTPRGRAFLSFWKGSEGPGGPVGLQEAVGAEAYLLMVDVLSRSRGAEVVKAVGDMSRRRGELIVCDGVAPSGLIHRQVLFGRFSKRFSDPVFIRPVARVAVVGSDPVADVGAQELLGDHGEVRLVRAARDGRLHLGHLFHPDLGGLLDRLVYVLHQLDRGRDVDLVGRVGR
ncbi:MAG TPA: hypothetical protein PLS81_07510 [Deltaproteobacteria bacterium]|nr:hypothetical protein [Deltaproteobacteria bacterium]HPP80704.1 hypothetical protein [Deltaproteobacteria bacterium]